MDAYDWYYELSTTLLRYSCMVLVVALFCAWRSKKNYAHWQKHRMLHALDASRRQASLSQTALHIGQYAIMIAMSIFIVYWTTLGLGEE